MAITTDHYRNTITGATLMDSNSMIRSISSDVSGVVSNISTTISSNTSGSVTLNWIGVKVSDGTVFSGVTRANYEHVGVSNPSMTSAITSDNVGQVITLPTFSISFSSSTLTLATQFYGDNSNSYRYSAVLTVVHRETN